MRQTIGFRWLGVAGVEISAFGYVLLIDPFLSRPPLHYFLGGRVTPDTALIERTVQRCDYVLVSHSHWDHLMDVPQVVSSTGAVALGSHNTCEVLALSGIAVERRREIAVGDEIELGPFRVQVSPGRHGLAPGLPAPGALHPGLRLPLRLRDYRMDTCLSFAVDVDGYRLAFTPGPAKPANALLLGIQSSRAFYQALLGGTQPELIVPLHWDNLFQPLSLPPRPLIPPWGRGLARFGQLMAELAPQARVFVPQVLRQYDLRELP